MKLLLVLFLWMTERYLRLELFIWLVSWIFWWNLYLRLTFLFLSLRLTIWCNLDKIRLYFLKYSKLPDYLDNSNGIFGEAICFVLGQIRMAIVYDMAIYFKTDSKNFINIINFDIIVGDLFNFIWKYCVCTIQANNMNKDFVT